MEEVEFIYEEMNILHMLQEGRKSGIIKRHFESLGFGKFDVKLKLDELTLHARECDGSYVMFVVRRKDTREMVGYIGFTISEHLHHGDRVAQAHALWTDEEYRNLYVGQALLQFCESKLYHKHNCRFVQLTSNTNKSIGQWIEKQGYQATDVVYTKQFEKEDGREDIQQSN